MKPVLSRRLFLSGLLASAAVPALAEPPVRSLRPRLRGGEIARRTIKGPEALLAEARLGGRVAYAVADAKTGQLLEARDGARALPPASVAKVLTALYALDTLGGDYRFETRLIATGPVQNGVLAGDLVLAGGGDPVLATDDLAAMAAALKAAGLREVRGRFLVWGGALPYAREIDTAQLEHLGYNPAICGLNVNFNRVHFEWKRSGSGYAVTMDGRSAKHRPDVSIARMRIADRRAPVYTYADGGGRDEWTVAKAALGKGGARWLPVRRPALYAGDLFRTFAASHGIALSAAREIESLPAGRALATHESPTLVKLVRDMLKYSTNLTAEVLGQTATLARGGRSRSLAASAQLMNAWAKAEYGLTDVALVDHSGLGDASRIAAADMVACLSAARRAGVLPGLLKPIAMRDSKGRTDKTHPVTVHAKTGTLNFVSALAGYATGPDGRELAFAIFAADIKSRARALRANDEVPEGARGWNRRAKGLQQGLIERWSAVYGA